MAEPSQSGSAPPQGRTPFDALTEQLRLPPGWGPRLTLIFLLAAVATASSFFVSRGLTSQHVPVLGPDRIGTPFRAASGNGFKAGRDYEIVDRERTEQLRQEAKDAARPVYDFNPAVSNEVRQSIQDAFAGMRVLVEQRRTKLADAERASADAGTHGKKKQAIDEKEEEEALTALLNAERKTFEQKLLPIENDDWDGLVEARFSKEVELAALALIDRAYPVERDLSVPVAASRDDFSRVDGAITIRDVATRRERQSATEQPALIDMREARAELDRFSSVPGNLLPDSRASLRRAVLRFAKRQIKPNLTVNTAETEARRNAAAAAVKDAVIRFKKGQMVLEDGKLIDAHHLFILDAMRSQTRELDAFQSQLGGFGLVAVLVAAAFAFMRDGFRRFRPTRKDVLLLGLLLLAMLGLIRVWTTVADAIHDKYGDLPVEALYFAFPVAAGAMLVRFVLSQELALFFTLVVSCLAGVMLENSLAFGVFTLVGSLVAADRITRAKDRVGIFKAGLVTGAANFLIVFVFALAEGKGFSSEVFSVAMFSFIGTSIGVPVMVMALTPLVEVSFGYASDIKLLELANLNHPALKELIVQAPGTYHHSIIMGSLVEAAAESIGANPLLARSCAYYHDIGKGRNPLYFAENQKGDNRHDQLAPAMSAVIIKRHVTEGMEMARQYRLPKLVADAIPQHHGTRLVGFFYHRAVKEQEGKENPLPIDESIYRYAGPKPQFREAALVMIADAVEAASRSLVDQSTPRLQALVQKMINMVFSEGQLDECDLTLKDLNLIAQSFVHTLEGIYHARPAYPAGPSAAKGAPMGLTIAADSKRTGSV